MAAVASATVTGPWIVGIIAGKCAYACMFAAGAIAGLLLALQTARTHCLLCEKNCDPQFPPVPQPRPKPGPYRFARRAMHPGLTALIGSGGVSARASWRSARPPPGWSSESASAAEPLPESA